MKTLITIFILLMFSSSSWAMEMPPADKSPEIKGKCPKTKVVGDVSDCFRCHVESTFEVKEPRKQATRRYPTVDMQIKTDGDEYGHFLLTTINAGDVEDFFDYLLSHQIKRAVVEVHSPGGSLLDAWRIVGLMTAAKARGITVETKCHGFAASAGFLIFISGSMGSRAISPQSEVMWHELMSFKMFSIDTPSSSEEEARVLRHLQDTANSYIATRGNLTKEELDEKVKKKEFWLNGKQAFDDGFADILLTGEK